MGEVERIEDWRLKIGYPERKNELLTMKRDVAGGRVNLNPRRSIFNKEQKLWHILKEDNRRLVP
jgi:hypothetical protein